MPADYRQRVTSTIQLELRKARLRVVLLDSAGNAPSKYDAALGVGFITIGTRMLDSRFVVSQRATLDRIGRSIWATTWTSENASDRDADGLVMQGTNAFLSKWLDANGR